VAGNSNVQILFALISESNLTAMWKSRHHTDIMSDGWTWNQVHGAVPWSA
jgi:hypothetical protein